MDAHNDTEFASKKLSDYWKEVDLYIGGSEHATGHLLYVRFWTKALKDLGYISIEEPAKKLINQGMIQGRSNFVYFFSAKLKIVGQQETLPFSYSSLLISKGIVDKIISSNYSGNEYDDLLKKIESIFLFKIISAENPKFIALNVDVNIVENDILNVEEYVKWKPELNQSKFILEERKYICGYEVEKMSKSKYNVVSPDDIAGKYGADTLRLYEMFLGPLEQSKPWNTNGITGVHGFLKKLWRLFYNTGSFAVADLEPTKAELKALHKSIKKITEDIERFSFNTSVSNFMILVNELTDLKCNKRAILEPLLIILSPYAPHITEELWHQLGHKESIAFAPFPVFNEAYLVEDNFAYPISFNGKTRFNIELPLTLSQQEIEKIVMEAEQTHKYLEGKTPKKVIVVPKKIVNIVM